MYKLFSNDPIINQPRPFVLRVSDNAFIPFCPDNTDYQRFKVDVADGAELLDSEGNLVDWKEFLKTLP